MITTINEFKKTLILEENVNESTLSNDDNDQRMVNNSELEDDLYIGDL